MRRDSHTYWMAWLKFGCVLAVLLLTTGCIRRAVDAFVTGNIVARATDVPDVNKVCTMGTALASAIAGTSRDSTPPHKALIIAETTAGLCDEAVGWEADLEQEKVRKNMEFSDSGRIALIKDARLKETRARARAAQRFYRAWQHTEATWGPIGEGECPSIRQRDELTYLLGLFSGTMALIHDKASDSRVGVPLDLLNKVARGASCLDTEAWWHVPTALQAGAWATIPGSGPEGVDPWAMMREEAKAGEDSGVRLAWALHNLISANADRMLEVADGIRAHAAALASSPGDPTWLLLDEYARLVTLHESDLIWVKAEGYRTPILGELPGDTHPELEVSSPFEADPFAPEPATEPSMGAAESPEDK